MVINIENMKIDAILSEEKYHLPIEISEKIKTFWNKAKKENPNIWNGEQMCVSKFERKTNNISIICQKSNYAHYLYDERIGLPKEYACSSLVAGCLLETSDHYYIVGELAENTSFPHCMQVSGGSVDNNDIDNWGGGYILIGVEEENGRPKMQISGLELSEIDKIQKELLAKCKLIQPSYTPIVDVAQYKGKNILVVWCFGGQTRPYKCPTTLDKDFSKGYSYYIRKMSSTVKATETEQKELYDMARTIPFDDRMNHEAEIRDLKLPLIQNYLYEIKSDLLKESKTMDFMDLCKSMRIVDGTPEYMKPLNVGVMFFNDEPQKFFPYSQIEVVDLRNGPEGDDMTEQIFKGPIDSMIKSALTYIKNTVIVEKILKIDGQAEAVRFFNYPYQAIEEALVNAVYHRGYDVREPVEVRIMEDRIHIVSYPGPDRSISEKSIEDKNMIARKYRNRRIGEFLKELKLTEGRNTGVPKIKRALKNNGSKEPEFETNETRDYFITTIFMHDGFENEIKDRPRTDQEPTKLSEQEIKILEFCKEPHSKKEIMEYMEYKHTRNFTMLYLKPLLEKGLLQMTIPEKPNHKNQKYIKK